MDHTIKPDLATKIAAKYYNIRLQEVQAYHKDIARKALDLLKHSINSYSEEDVINMCLPVMTSILVEKTKGK